MFGEQTALQLIDPPVGVLVALALASIGVYGIVLGGWASGSTYPLLGGLRSAAQMISYDVAMGLSFVAVFLYAGHAVHLGDRRAAAARLVRLAAAGVVRRLLRVHGRARPTGRRSIWPRPRASWSAASTPSTPRCGSGCSSWPSTST